MGLIAKILSFARAKRNGVNVTDVKSDPGGGFNVTPLHFSSAGDDSHPLLTDYTVLIDTQQSGQMAAIGYADTTNVAVALAGEKRIYSRDSAGAIVAQVYLKNTGEIEASNDNCSVVLNPDGHVVVGNGSGTIDLLANGDVDINGVVIKANGDVTIPSSLVLAGKEIAGHMHPYTWTDPAGAGSTGGNL